MNSLRKSLVLALVLMVLAVGTALAQTPGTAPPPGYVPGTWPTQPEWYNQAVNQTAWDQMKGLTNAGQAEAQLNANLEAAIEAGGVGSGAPQTVGSVYYIPPQTAEYMDNVSTAYQCVECAGGGASQIWGNPDAQFCNGIAGACDTAAMYGYQYP